MRIVKEKFRRDAKDPCDVDVKLIKLQKAMVAVEKLLFGDLFDEACRVIIIPDLKALKPQALRLTAVYGLDCEELAEILISRPTFLATPRAVEMAVAWLFSSKQTNPVENPGCHLPIRAAIESRDVKFFVKLGRAIEDRNRGKKQSAFSGLDELRFILMTWWKPSRKWPGLAYCERSARIDFLTILEQHKILSFPFIKNTTPNNLDNICLRLGLKPSKHPIISGVKDLGSSLRFS